MFAWFLGLSLLILALSIMTRQRDAVVAEVPMILSQLLAQWAIMTLDTPMSALPSIACDMVLAMQYAAMWLRSGRLWLFCAFFIQATACLVHVGFATMLEVGALPLSELLFGYYLLLNILFVMLSACNAWPGASDVANHVREYVRRTRLMGRLALRHEKRG